MYIVVKPLASFCVSVVVFNTTDSYPISNSQQNESMEYVVHTRFLINAAAPIDTKKHPKISLLL